MGNEATTEGLRKDIDNLAKSFRDSEEKLYDRIRESEKDLHENNTNIKLVIQKVQDFIEMFEKHDTNEMEKYTSIDASIKDMKREIKKLEDKYATKEDVNAIKDDVKTVADDVKKGFRIFYIGTGIFITIGGLGGLIMWILNLLTKINSLGG